MIGNCIFFFVLVFSDSEVVIYLVPTYYAGEGLE